MPHPYYALPLRLDEVLQHRQHPTCSLPQSIAQNLYLMLTTHFAESRFDASFGCSLWDEDFSNQTNSRWKEDIRQSIETSVAAHEKRLVQVRVRVDLVDQEIQLSRTNRRVKRRLSVWIDGLLMRTNEPFSFQRSLFLAPLSTE
ncbi:GPW/gp25 family protein [Spirosoma utsteinense]|uniref:Phage baseplate assembly protein W n=1 Tax=Spirosoma utsteinense TaxID=2585773 RepID=A0ABR6WCG5_9BACT|nr:GPW/gp25 family protein [Spirosoma utsteinense]MBC3788316.1 phage baseplate assembly protein W [Spirosoma utsteinense]MBC3794222.1 phage baseplate assembly protein W [Spirosoma utsteinense]